MMIKRPCKIRFSGQQQNSALSTTLLAKRLCQKLHACLLGLCYFSLTSHTLSILIEKHTFPHKQTRDREHIKKYSKEQVYFRFRQHIKTQKVEQSRVRGDLVLLVQSFITRLQISKVNKIIQCQVHHLICLANQSILK